VVQSPLVVPKHSAGRSLLAAAHFRCLWTSATRVVSQLHEGRWLHVFELASSSSRCSAWRSVWRQDDAAAWPDGCIARPTVPRRSVRLRCERDASFITDSIWHIAPGHGPTPPTYLGPTRLPCTAQRSGHGSRKALPAWGWPPCVSSTVLFSDCSLGMREELP
jgi:hypothetical protein